MTDHTDHEWPRAIWAFAIDQTEFEVSGTYVTSEHATQPRWEGDKERERPVHRYVDADIYDSADRYWRERCEAQAARIAELEAAQAWQPIETAPKTNRAILVWCPDRRNTYQVTWYDLYNNWAIFGGPSLTESPTHWMPLPPAPQAQEGE